MIERMRKKLSAQRSSENTALTLKPGFWTVRQEQALR
jgi:hypothetical protein